MRDLFALIATFLVTELISAKVAWLSTRVHKPKEKSSANPTQVSSKPGNSVENLPVVVNQCPISKAQCEQLLTFLNTGGGLGDAHHATTVSTGIEGVRDVVSNVVSTSSQS